MRRSRSDLVVPIRDRRQHRRIVTLPNFAKALLGLAILIAAANILSDARAKHDGEYGRLFGHELAKVDSATAHHIDVVTEAPVQESERADPLLLGAAAREQYLGTSQQPTTAQAQVLPEGDGFAPRQPVLGQTHGHVAIVGGAEGVSVVSASGNQKQPPNQPTLTGGIFK
jgi:hypothetical protein